MADQEDRQTREIDRPRKTADQEEAGRSERLADKRDRQPRETDQGDRQTKRTHTKN